VPLKHGRHTRVASSRIVASGRASCVLFPFCSHTTGPPLARTWPVVLHTHSPAEPSRAGQWQNASARTRERAGSVPLRPPGSTTSLSIPPVATPFACRQNHLCCPSAPLRVLLRHAHPLLATLPPPPDAGPALRSGLAASQVPSRPPSPGYCRARPRCPPCVSVLSCRTLAPSAHTRAARVPWPASCVCRSCSRFALLRHRLLGERKLR
jgi:hypothetical protein